VRKGSFRNEYFLPIVLTASAGAALVSAQSDEFFRSMNQPMEPFHVVGNVYYVGANEITAFLITTPEGHVLLDGGFEETAPMIEASIRKLGFKLEDVRYLLNSQAHVDHAGGLAALQERSGAKLVASAGDAAVLASGGRGDFAFEARFSWRPARVDRTVQDGEAVELGGARLVARLTPGHTRGCTTWTTAVEEKGKRLEVVFVGGTKVLPSVPLLGNTAYPQIAQDFESTFRLLRSMRCDVFLASHGSFFDLQDKARALAHRPARNPFVDPKGYHRFLDRTEKEFRQKLESEKLGRGDRGSNR
jgi:metallo-beta-lactamase class B